MCLGFATSLDLGAGRLRRCGSEESQAESQQRTFEIVIHSDTIDNINSAEVTHFMTKNRSIFCNFVSCCSKVGANSKSDAGFCCGLALKT